MMSAITYANLVLTLVGEKGIQCKSGAVLATVRYDAVCVRGLTPTTQLLKLGKVACCR
jgi:hypothetical protein